MVQELRDRQEILIDEVDLLQRDHDPSLIKLSQRRDCIEQKRGTTKTELFPVT